MGDIIRLDSVDDSRYLDDKREQFCRNIVAGMGIIASYRNAIDSNASDEVAYDMGKRYAMIPTVANRITHLEENRRVIRDTTRDDIVADLKRMYDVSISDYFHVSGGIWELKHPSEWTEAMRRACSKIKPTKFGIELEIQGKEWLVDKINDAMGYKLPEEGNTEMSKYDNKTIQELKKTVLDLSEVIDITEEEDAEDAE